MSDSFGRLHLHQHLRWIRKLWTDEEWCKLTPESLLKSDKVIEAELLAMAKEGITPASSRPEEDDGFEDMISVRRAVDTLERTPREWTDTGLQRTLAMARGAASGDSGHSVNTINMGTHIIR